MGSAPSKYATLEIRIYAALMTLALLAVLSAAFREFRNRRAAAAAPPAIGDALPAES
jgi:hypothetical protein